MSYLSPRIYWICCRRSFSTRFQTLWRAPCEFGYEKLDSPSHMGHWCWKHGGRYTVAALLSISFPNVSPGSIHTMGFPIHHFRISVIFRVRSAKAVKITDMDLIKRLGIIVGIFVLCLLIRTLVSPPAVIVGKEKLLLHLINLFAQERNFTIFIKFNMQSSLSRKDRRKFEGLSVSVRLVGPLFYHTWVLTTYTEWNLCLQLRVGFFFLLSAIFMGGKK